MKKRVSVRVIETRKAVNIKGEEGMSPRKE
jgi:hypothetical protein